MIINNKRLTGIQAYREKNKNDYLLVDLLSFVNHPQSLFEGLASSVSESISSLAITTVSSEFLTSKCKAVSWKNIPKEWQDGFLERLEFPERQFKQSNNKQPPAQNKLF